MPLPPPLPLPLAHHATSVLPAWGVPVPLPVFALVAGLTQQAAELTEVTVAAAVAVVVAVVVVWYVRRSERRSERRPERRPERPLGRL